MKLPISLLALAAIGLSATYMLTYGNRWECGPKYNMPVVLVSADGTHHPNGTPLNSLEIFLAGSGREEEIWLGILGFGCCVAAACGKRFSANPDAAARPREDGIAGAAGGAQRHDGSTKPSGFSIANSSIKRTLAAAREKFRKVFRFESKAGAAVFCFLICGYLLALRQTMVWLQLRTAGKAGADEVQAWLAELAGSVAGIVLLLNLVLLTVVIEYRRLHNIICTLKPQQGLPPATPAENAPPPETAPMASAGGASRRPDKAAGDEPGAVTIPIGKAHGPYWRPGGA
ncbi:MAG TPA: hypothetical protein VHC19_29315 [Pirellulales bacterium]|nr:hypothetical protein [Pirellulales bacterium]